MLESVVTFSSDFVVEHLEVFLEPALTLSCTDLPGENQVHKRRFYENVANKSCNHAERKVKCQQVEHRVVRQEKGLIKRGDESCVDQRKDQIDQVAETRKWGPELETEEVL